MARETKAARLVRERTEKLLKIEQERTEYPNRVMRALRQASLLGYSIFVETQPADFFDPESSKIYLYKIKTNYDFIFCRELLRNVYFTVFVKYDDHVDAAYLLHLFEKDIEEEQEEREQVTRKQQIRENALSKLSTEEKEALGLE